MGSDKFSKTNLHKYSKEEKIFLCYVYFMTVSKPTLSIKNKTHYFSPETTKITNTVVSPKTYYYEQSKVKGYETRLFYEFKYCQDHQGQTFFYTFTYNDKNIPQYLGKNCFDYNDIRSFLNGGFTKYLLRHYGTSYKYFVGAELGDGKGSRGWHNNPHYHIIFFLRDAQDERYPYQKITEKEMTSLLRLYWQGEDNTDWVHRAQYYKKGIVSDDRPGKGPVVNDFKALNYVSKYVVKDINLVMMEQKIKDHFIVEFSKTILEEEESFKRFWYEWIVPFYNPGNRWDDKELFKRIVGHTPYKKDYGYLAGKVIEELGVLVEYQHFCTQLVNEKVDEKIKEYRNRYCNKCRVSQGLGDYALDFIDKTNPSLQVPSKNGIYNRGIGMYYYRKLYCDVVKDDQGQNIYVLNQDGIDYKLSKLDDAIKECEKRTLSALACCPNEEMYDKVIKSEVNDLGDGRKRVYMSFNEYKDYINNDIENKIKCYAIYKMVYEGRFFKVQDDGCPALDYKSDYRKFITPLVDKVDYADCPVDAFLQGYCQGYLAYHSHPYFLSDSWIYPVFDLLADYYFISDDNQKRKESEERKKTRKFHIARAISDVYGQSC